MEVYWEWKKNFCWRLAKFRWRMKWRSEEWRLRFYSKKLTFIHYTVHSRTGSNTLHLTSYHCTSAFNCSTLHTMLHTTLPHCTSLLHTAHTLHLTAHLHHFTFEKEKDKKKFRAWLKKVVIVRLKSGENPVEILFSKKIGENPVNNRILTGF